MAASSGGLHDWATVLQPIFSSNEIPITLQDIYLLVNAISARKEEFLNPTKEFSSKHHTYYAYLTVVLTDVIVNSLDLCTEPEQLNKLYEGTLILLESLLRRFHPCKPVLIDETCNKRTFDGIMISIETLVTSQSRLTDNDRQFYYGAVKLVSPPFMSQSTSASTTAPASTTSRSIVKRPPRNELLEKFYEGPLNLTTDIRSQFINKHIEFINRLPNFNFALFDFCYKQKPLIQFYIIIQDRTVNSISYEHLALPTDIVSLKHDLKDIYNSLSLVHTILGLQIFWGFSRQDQLKLSKICRGLTALAVTVSNSSMILANMPNSTCNSSMKEDLDRLCHLIVRMSLEVCYFIEQIFQTCSCYPHIARNNRALCVDILFQGLWMQLHTFPISSGSGKTEEKRIEDKYPDIKVNINKTSQSFTVLNAAIAFQAIKNLQKLIDEMKKEESIAEPVEKPASYNQFDLFYPYTPNELVHFATQNTARIFDVLHLVALISARKSYISKRVVRENNDEDTVSFSDSTIYNGEDFSFSSQSSGDEDSEPILGRWLESTLAPKVVAETSEIESVRDEQQMQSYGAHQNPPDLIPDKSRVDGFIQLSTDILELINKYYVESGNSILTRAICAHIKERHMCILANILDDIDKESDHPKTGVIAHYHTNILGMLYQVFSHYVMLYKYNLSKKHILPNSLEMSLLCDLNIQLAPEVANISIAYWPLTIRARSLLVLVQYLCGRDQDEVEGHIMTIWSRFIHTVLEVVLHRDLETYKPEDVNLEHAQTLLFLFHTHLSLLQKKMILLKLANAIISISETDVTDIGDLQVLLTARLLHMFEHIIRHLYEPPKVFVDQFKWNLMVTTSLELNENFEKISYETLTKKYFECDEKWGMKNIDSAGIEEWQPKFYMLTPVEFSNEEVPKLDGLACNFLFTSADKLNYNDLILGLCNLMGIIDQLNFHWFMHGESWKSRMPTNLTTLQYTFLSIMRILLLLPPSTEIMSKIYYRDKDVQELSYSLLYETIWGPRSSCNVYNTFIKDSLNKQSDSSVKTKADDNYLDNLGLWSNSIMYTMTLLDAVIPKMTEHFFRLNFYQILFFNIVISKLLVHINADEGKVMSIKEIAPSIEKLLEILLGITGFMRRNIISLGDHTLTGSSRNYDGIMTIASSQNAHTAAITSGLRLKLVAQELVSLSRWSAITISCPALGSMPRALIPSEAAVITNVSKHISKLHNMKQYGSNDCLKYATHNLLALFSEFYAHAKGDSYKAIKEKMMRTLIPLTLDATLEFLPESSFFFIAEDPRFEALSYEMLIDHCASILDPFNSNKIGVDVIKVLEDLLDIPNGAVALYKYFAGKQCFRDILLCRTGSSINCYFFNKLFGLAPKIPELQFLCKELIRMLSWKSNKQISDWLHYVYLGQFKNDSGEDLGRFHYDSAYFEECHQMMNSLSNYILKDTAAGETLATNMLEGLIPIATHMLLTDPIPNVFIDIMQLMISLAKATSRGYINLFFAATSWLQCWEDFLTQQDLTHKYDFLSDTKLYVTRDDLTDEEMERDNSRTRTDALAQILSFVADIVIAIAPCVTRESRASSPSILDEASSELDLEDYFPEDTDSTDESDDENLCNKLCTFTLTQKQFMNQHWYHCYTCNMVDGVGVCSICVKVCHKNHEVTYSKYGNFFCDCGAKEDGSCSALVKRNPLTSDEAQSPVAMEVESTSTDSVEQLEEIEQADESNQRCEFALRLGLCAEPLMDHLEASTMITELFRIMELLKFAMKPACEINSSIGCQLRAKTALQRLHEVDKKFQPCDELMFPTVGSQEGAFDNVRSNYPGDQSQAIRQLLSAHMIRRVAMCCLSSPHGKKQHLAVCHEKGKIAILQLSSLLKQTDNSKRQLTLTRLATAPIPFTVLSITGNPANEDYLAVCGLKDCHVLVFNSSGSVAQHLFLHPYLESGNYIIKALWLPGSQTKLAVITADFIKIYDLSLDILSPQYYFVLPSGKVRDATFIYPEPMNPYTVHTPYVLIMSSAGYIYSQVLCDESKANGMFYVTNTLEIKHSEIQESNGVVAGGGVSVYYSHTLQLIFFSYTQGKNFFASYDASKAMLGSLLLNRVFKIHMVTRSVNNSNSTASSSSSKSSSNNQALHTLWQWSEVHTHPGLITCVLQSTNNPIILLLKPSSVKMQEIRIIPSKSKIIDSVTIRHLACLPEFKTTMLILSEDGSLRIYSANKEKTGYWLSPILHNNQRAISEKISKKGKKSNKPVQTQQQIQIQQQQQQPSNSTSFPVDFFESCTVLDDCIEYGGQHLLEVYAPEQVKSRLKTEGHYICNQRNAGFTAEITLNDPSMVITGLRVHVGSQELLRSPSFIEVLGRSIHLNVSGPRWYDFPLTYEESVRSDRKLYINFGPSHDPHKYIMVDSIIIYGKTKENFGWSEESEDIVTTNTKELEEKTPLTALDKVVSSILEILNGFYTLFPDRDTKPAKYVVKNLLTMPTVSSIQVEVKQLLKTIIPSMYHHDEFYDCVLFGFVYEKLMELSTVKSFKDVDAELYYRIVQITRQLAYTRSLALPKLIDEMDECYLKKLYDIFWCLYIVKPKNEMRTPFYVPGLRHTESTVRALTEIGLIFFLPSYKNLQVKETVIEFYIQTLLCEDIAISFSAKHALIHASAKLSTFICTEDVTPLLINHIKDLKNTNGVQCIPFLQVLFYMVTDKRGIKHLPRMIEEITDILDIRNSPEEAPPLNSNRLKVNLVLMKFLIVIISRKCSEFPLSDELSKQIVAYCLVYLITLTNHWSAYSAQSQQAQAGDVNNTSVVLKVSPAQFNFDMSPIFNNDGKPIDIFENPVELLTELLLRLAYQILKHNTHLTSDWKQTLHCYIMFSLPVTIRRQSRKLLQFLCGSKAYYRLEKDKYSLSHQIQCISKICAGNSVGLPTDLTYPQLVSLMEHLKRCQEIASSRTYNWQRFCAAQGDDGLKILPYLFGLCCSLDENITPTVLQLIQLSITPNLTQISKASVTPEEVEANVNTNCLIILTTVPSEMFCLFIKIFLLDVNSTHVRLQAHDVIKKIYNSSQTHKFQLLNIMWEIWPVVNLYGKKAAQFIDLIGHFSINTPVSKEEIEKITSNCVTSLRSQTELLSRNENSKLYHELLPYVNAKGFYFETLTCSVCNIPEIPLSNIKLSSIKVDSKFTTSAQYVKLVNSHAINRITLRIGEVKQAKMVKQMNIFYNNRTVQAIVELKNKPDMWEKAKCVQVASEQSEVKIEFPLPIVACNLMIEYSEFYENIQAASDTLQCPRCGVSVPANPGVCGNCGENVYQCHKCRAINYDVKDPFLCHSCGYCKYAKFDYTLTAKPCCAIDHIKSVEDRNKTIANISSIEERSYRVSEQLKAHKENIRRLLANVGHPERSEDATAIINQSINQIAQIYCVDSKNAFEELGKNSQKVIASRTEILDYDSKQYGETEIKTKCINTSRNTCYGCGISMSDHCLIMLKALTSVPFARQYLANVEIIKELLENNLNTFLSSTVKSVLCSIVINNEDATKILFHLLLERIQKYLSLSGQSMKMKINMELDLITSLLNIEDTCWELKMKYIFKLYIMAASNDSKIAVSSVVVPCLQIFTKFILPKVIEKDNIEAIEALPPTTTIDVAKWLDGKFDSSYWNSKLYNFIQESPHDYYLMEKYGLRWKNKVKNMSEIDKFLKSDHLKQALFNPDVQTRQSTCKLVEVLFVELTMLQRLDILDRLASFLPELTSAGHMGCEYLQLYRTLLQVDAWKIYAAKNGVLFKIAQLMSIEIDKIKRLENSSLVSDVNDGFTLKMLTDLLSNLLEVESTKKKYKSSLVGDILLSYLALRKFAVQRTKLIDETQDKLFELLEELTSGTQEETKEFMKICFDALENCSDFDFLTPVFIIERLCSIISPKENDIGEFFLTLEKDPHQEDFLQGRMLGNPYSSLEAGLGPLMRDVKNKICQDCELVALLEDDNGMELLVNNKIISLNLPVKEVYKKIWLTEVETADSMRVVYRMRGLLGDATEEFIETLDHKSKQEINYEEVYKLANVISECRGLELLLMRLEKINAIYYDKSLLQVLLQLLTLCVKVRSNQEKLTNPELNAVGILLHSYEKFRTSSSNPISEQILTILETILKLAAAKPLSEFTKLSNTFDEKQIQTIIVVATNEELAGKYPPTMLVPLAKIIGILTYGNEKRMEFLLARFHKILDYKYIDEKDEKNPITPSEAHNMSMFCSLCSEIEHTEAGDTLKKYINQLGIVVGGVKYITEGERNISSDISLWTCVNDPWKEFITKQSLKFILKFLAGISTHHADTQLEVSTSDCIAVLHRLEDTSSEAHIGTYAENLLEALRSNPDVAVRIEKVRQETRAEKKRLAMAMREKQLGALGMKANEKGQVVAKAPLFAQLDDLGEETGLTCVICREGYRFQPTKVLGIYTFTKKCPMEEEERRRRNSPANGYTTVTHFNVIHVDCHMAAVRQARSRDEWESAALQNANTRCNGLLPLWGPNVPESAFASSLARHNNYLLESTSHRDIGYNSTMHDLKLLLLRFAEERAFNEDTGGGGPESNMKLICYLIHMALYVLNTTRSGQKELKSLTAYMSANPDTWCQSAFVAEGPLYWSAMSLLLRNFTTWEKTDRIIHLKRILVLAHSRGIEPTGKPFSKAVNTKIQKFENYKPYLIYFGLIDGIYKYFFKTISSNNQDQWPAAVADYIRHNDETIMKASEDLLAYYSDELLPIVSLDEFCDVLGLLGEIENPTEFLTETLKECIK